MEATKPPPHIAPSAPASSPLRHELRFALAPAALRAHGRHGLVGYGSDQLPGCEVGQDFGAGGLLLRRITP